MSTSSARQPPTSRSSSNSGSTSPAQSHQDSSSHIKGIIATRSSSYWWICERLAGACVSAAPAAPVELAPPGAAGSGISAVHNCSAVNPTPAGPLFEGGKKRDFVARGMRLARYDPQPVSTRRWRRVCRRCRVSRRCKYKPCHCPRILTTSGLGSGWDRVGIGISASPCESGVRIPQLRRCCDNAIVLHQSRRCIQP